MDASLTEAQQKAAPRVVKQFSDAYFELIRQNADIAPFLTFDETVLLLVGSEVVRIEP